MAAPHIERRLDRAAAAMERSQRRARHDARVGLSRCHIRPRYYAEVAPSGAYLSVHSIGERQTKVPTWTRGIVQGFSRRSRARLLKTMARCDRAETSRSLLVTLTYPRSYPAESATSKLHLKAFSKRLMRAFPHGSAIWKYELQARGAPHYHLIVLGVPFLARQWLSRAWYQVVGSGDPRHLRAGTQVQRVKSYRKALGYAAKYVAKVTDSEADTPTGRVWGVVGRERLPIHLVSCRLDRRRFERIVRVIRKLIAKRSKKRARRRYPSRWAIMNGERGAALVALT